MPTPFFDTHAHLDFPDFAEEIPALLQRAQDAGITRIITIGTNLESSRRAIRIAEENPNVFAVVGWHPSDAMLAPDDLRHELFILASHPRVVALGETGLDYYRLPGKSDASKITEDTSIKQKQAVLFQQHLEVAADTGLNCVIHTRDSTSDTLALFKPFASRVRGVFHCFVQDSEIMEMIFALNSIVSFTGIATFKNADVVHASIIRAPLGKFMVETDAPFLAPVPYRGKRCEPSFVLETARKIATLKGCSLADLSDATCRAAHDFFPKLQ